MLEINKILFPTDFSEESNQVLPYTLQLAGGMNAELHLLHATILHDYKGIDPFPAYQVLETALTDRVKSMLRAMAKEAAGGQPLTIHRVERRGLAAAPTILDYAEEAGIDLIVMATHGRRGLRKAFLGSVAQEVVRHATMPVLTVRGRAVLGGGSPTRMLATIDFSPMTPVVLDAAGDMARRVGAEITLLHVMELPETDLFGHGEREVALARSAMMDRVRNDMEQQAERLRHAGHTVRVEVVRGSAPTEILRASDRLNADLLILGSHHHSAVDRFVLGSVSERVLQRATRPVLTLKSEHIVEREPQSAQIAI